MKDGPTPHRQEVPAPPRVLLECDFILRARDAAAGAYPLLVLTPSGSATGTLAIPMDQQFTNLVALVRDEGPDLEARERLGHQLYTALTNDKPIHERWAGTLQLVKEKKARLRLRLWIEPPDLMAMPWELLYHSEYKWLGARPDIFVSRYVPGPEPRSLPPAPRPRILVIVAETAGLLGPGPKQLGALGTVLDDLATPGGWDLMTAPPLAEALEKLGSGYDVLHFIGHGNVSGIQWVAAGQKQVLSPEQLGQLVIGQPRLRLVVLNACGSAEVAPREQFSGMAPALIRSGIPAVIAMQYPEVTQTVAQDFNVRFYRALKSGFLIDEALTQARQALTLGPLLWERAWSTPVLYLGTRLPGELRLGGSADWSDPWEALRAADETITKVREAFQLATAGLRELDRPLQKLGQLLALRKEIELLREKWAVTVQFVASVTNGDAVPDRGAVRRVGQNWAGVKAGPGGSLFRDPPPSEEVLGFVQEARTAATDVEKVVEEVARGQLVQVVEKLAAALERADADISARVAAMVTEAVGLSRQTLAKVPAL
jgi:CHAT domain